MLIRWKKDKSSSAGSSGSKSSSSSSKKKRKFGGRDGGKCINSPTCYTRLVALPVDACFTAERRGERRKRRRDARAALAMLSAASQTSGRVSLLVTLKTEDRMFVGRCICCRAVLLSPSCRPVRGGYDEPCVPRPNELYAVCSVIVEQKHDLPTDQLPTGETVGERCGEICAALKIEYGATLECGAGEIPEKTRRPAAFSATIPTCENLGAAPPGIENGSSGWEASSLTTTPPRPWEDNWRIASHWTVPAKSSCATYGPTLRHWIGVNRTLNLFPIRFLYRQGSPRQPWLTPRPEGRSPGRGELEQPAIRGGGGIVATYARIIAAPDGNTGHRLRAKGPLPRREELGSQHHKHENESRGLPSGHTCSTLHPENHACNNSAEMQGRRKREIPEKIRRPAASSGTMIPICENPGVTQPGIEPGSPSWKASSLTALPPRSRPTEIALIRTCLWLIQPKFAGRIEIHRAGVAYVRVMLCTEVNTLLLETPYCIRLSVKFVCLVLKPIEVSSAVHTRRTLQEPATRVEPGETECIAATHERAARYPLHTYCDVNCAITFKWPMTSEKLEVTMNGLQIVFSLSFELGYQYFSIMSHRSIRILAMQISSIPIPKTCTCWIYCRQFRYLTRTVYCGGIDMAKSILRDPIRWTISRKMHAPVIEFSVVAPRRYCMVATGHLCHLAPDTFQECSGL
ncbi:hypothetical protein PR048_023062 [Dryococelus australis]|uniref:Uncharacterized protein n=1 Tax=Dryococelus australis TaxID=614101 RepID=A0ABQ9GT25_9NEOP|nr:hypothetical protein PR048_023062 [Dryococelus australis]